MLLTTVDLECPCLNASRVAKREKKHRASFPQFPNVSTARGMHDHPSAWHLASLAACFLVSAAKAAAPSWMLASFRVAGVRGEVLVTSQAADLALSHPSTSTSAGRE